jgi:hypothetical protein
VNSAECPPQLLRSRIDGAARRQPCPKCTTDSSIRCTAGRCGCSPVRSEKEPMQIAASTPLTNRELSPTVGAKPAVRYCLPRPYPDYPSRLSPADRDRIAGASGPVVWRNMQGDYRTRRRLRVIVTRKRPRDATLPVLARGVKSVSFHPWSCAACVIEQPGSLEPLAPPVPAPDSQNTSRR